MSKTAFITGASRGIGRGIALKLGNAGYDIAFTYNSQKEDALSLQKEIESLGQTCKFYQASLEEKGVAEDITNSVIKDFKQIDVLVCNAGKTEFTSIKELDVETMDFLYQLNYRSYVISTSLIVNQMIKNKIKGKIIYISSTRGIRAYKNDGIYGSLKAALNRLVQSLALELAEHDITINSVAPGATKVREHFSNSKYADHMEKIIPMQRFGTPEDVASLVEFLVSEKATYITGETIKIDGGLILYGPNENPKGGIF